MHDIIRKKKNCFHNLPFPHVIFIFLTDVTKEVGKKQYYAIMSKPYVPYFHNPIKSVFHLVIRHITQDEYVVNVISSGLLKIITYNSMQHY